uniref:ATP-binding cassette, sub-family D (ALD), member 3b n=1 Tax=Cyprinus carpio carpio TaxID=630221 RepID=A0A8C1HNS2_CYPCA
PPSLSDWLHIEHSSIAGALLFAVYVLNKDYLRKPMSKIFYSYACSHLFTRSIFLVVFSPQSGYLLLIDVMLMARTYCDVWMIHNETMIESAITGSSTTAFKRYLVNFITVMPFISLVNNLLKLRLNELKLCFRVNLTNRLYNDYLTGFTYYKIGNLDNRIANPDQLITQDVEKFCNSVVDLYSNVSKPLLDILIYICKLNTAIGSLGPASLLSYLVFSGLLLTRYEGQYRYVNSRLIINIHEEIVFYNGNRREKQTINGTFQKLVRKIKIVSISKFFYVCFTLQDYYQSGRMLISLAQALGRIVLAGREMTRLSGFTARITEFQEVLKENHSNIYIFSFFFTDDSLEKIPLTPGRGQIIIADNIIKFEHIPLATPSGDILIRDLSFEVSSGTNVLVCVPNGCGKSSLFRVLGELWPLWKLFYVPQRPYMTLRSLRDQVIYPDTHEDQKKKGMSDRVFHNEMDIKICYYEYQSSLLFWMSYSSAVSVDVGITLFTVSHRKSLWKHHEVQLRNYKFKPITKGTVEYGS